MSGFHRAVPPNELRPACADTIFSPARSSHVSSERLGNQALHFFVTLFYIDGLEVDALKTDDGPFFIAVSAN
jgi:hypothetical protein